MRLERHEQAEGLEPGGMLPAKGGKRSEVGAAVRAGTEEAIRGGGGDRWELPVEPSKIDLLDGEVAEPGQLPTGEEPRVLQFTPIDEIGIPGETGKSLIRRVAIARGPERADLPVAKTAVRQKIHKRPGALPEIPDAIPAWQAGDMGEHARRSRHEPGSARRQRRRRIPRRVGAAQV
jgi:hypothetical protein